MAASKMPLCLETLKLVALRHLQDILADIIYRCVDIKRQVVEQDQFEYRGTDVF